MSGTEHNLVNAGPTQEPTIADLLNRIRELELRQEEDKKQYEDLRNRNNRRATLYVPSTPMSVSGRTSMGGVVNLTSSSSSAEEELLLGDFEQKEISKITTMKVKEPPLFEGQANSDVKRWLELMEDFMSCFSESEVMKVQKVML
jgi:hypothetical protein